MNFEHVLIVNDPANPLLSDLTREELWFGLLCRAEDARPFLPGLDECRILQRSDSELVRELRFGQVRIRDRVILEPMNAVSFESERTEEHPGGVLRITIEEPEDTVLVLRFHYRTTLPEGGTPDSAYVEYVKSAYHQSDIDTLRVIRMITESTRLQ